MANEQRSCSASKPSTRSKERNENYKAVMLAISSVKFSRSVLSDFNRMNRSTPGLPVHQQEEKRKPSSAINAKK